MDYPALIGMFECDKPLTQTWRYKTRKQYDFSQVPDARYRYVVQKELCMREIVHNFNIHIRYELVNLSYTYNLPIDVVRYINTLIQA